MNRNLLLATEQMNKTATYARAIGATVQRLADLPNDTFANCTSDVKAMLRDVIRIQELLAKELNDQAANLIRMEGASS